jgi:hypothetical protein
MKKLNAIIVLTLTGISLFAQIPNSGFDTWINKGTYDIPDRWGTLNNTTPKDSDHTVEKGNPGNPALYYMKIISRPLGNSVVNGIAVSGKLDTITMQPISGFAYAGQPKSFTGKWEFMWMNASPGSVSATLTKWNVSTKQREVVATASQILGGMIMSWETFSIDFSYVSATIPDSCLIVLKASGSDPGNGDYLFVDDLAFTGSVAGVQVNSGFVNSIRIYQNAIAKNIIVNFNLTQPENILIQITDLTGKRINETTTRAGSGFTTCSLSVDGVAPGTYFVNFISREGIETIAS